MWPGFITLVNESSSHFPKRYCWQRRRGGGRNRRQGMWMFPQVHCVLVSPYSPLGRLSKINIWVDLSGSLMWKWNLSIFTGDFSESIAHGWHYFFFIGSPASSLSTLIHTALLIVQYLQRGLSLDRAFSEACWDAYVRSQASPANQKVLWSVSHSFLRYNVTGNRRKLYWWQL